MATKFPLFGELRKAMQVGMQCFASVIAKLCKCHRNALQVSTQYYCSCYLCLFKDNKTGFHLTMKPRRKLKQPIKEIDCLRIIF